MSCELGQLVAHGACKAHATLLVVSDAKISLTLVS